MRSLVPLAAFACLLGCEPPPPDVDPPPPPPPLATPYVVEPATCDAGRVPVDSVGSCALTVTNVSDIDVNVTGATDGPPFLALGAAGPVLAGESFVVTVNAVPRVAGVDTGELSLGPGRLVVPLLVEGIAGPTLAVTVSPDDIITGDTVTLDASATEGATSIEWAFDSQPAASSAELSSGSGTTTTFVADVVGTWQLTATATDEAGASDSAALDISARAPRNVLLTTTAGVLHLRPAAEVACGPLDCFAGACTDLVWGGPRSTPVAAGGGIVVDDLALGTYRATLMLAADAPATNATIRISEDGQLAGELLVALAPGDAVDAFDVVATNAGVAIEERGDVVTGGACP